ncbi:isoprenylcysteine carboxylmethyltransferase family protein [OM182 bacterium]|jgi:protein-S-isoprenylcysteine O-methyltransferase Ste14|nr:isoprenylcysteine carboxylmethyltransferase family protein [OM182 bacterium]
MMNNKIPPPVIALICGLVIYFTRALFPKYVFTLTNFISILFLVLGLLMLITAVLSFKKYQTTVNPLRPEKASQLVTSGIFKFSRNPMYFAMLLVLLSITVKFNILGGAAMSVAFVLFITTFQIIPEELAMKKLFGGEFDLYQESTRRWI